MAVSTGSRNHPAVDTFPEIWHGTGSGSGRIFILNEKGFPEKRIEVAKPYLTGKIVPQQNLLAIFSGGALALYDLHSGQIASAYDVGTPLGTSVQASPDPPFSPPGRLPQSHVVSAHRILALSFLWDGKRLASAGDEGVLRLWDPAGGKEITTIQVTGSLPFAISQSGNLAHSGDGASVVISDIESSAARYPLQGFGEKVVSLSFSPGGDWLAAGGDNGSIGIWHIGHPDTQFILTGHKGPVRSVAFSRDTAVLASGGDDASVRIWDLTSRRPIRILKGHSKKVLAVAFGLERNSPASSGEDSAIIVWDVQKGRMGNRFWDPNGAVQSLCFSPDGSQLISAGSRSLRRWDVRGRKLLGILLPGRRDELEGRWSPATYGFFESFLVMSYSPKGEILACGGTNNTLLIWDTKDWEGKILSAAER